MTPGMYFGILQGGCINMLTYCLLRGLAKCMWNTQVAVVFWGKMKWHGIPKLEGNQIGEERFLYSVNAWFSDILDLTNRIIFHLSCV